MVEKTLRIAQISAEQINNVVILLLEKQDSDMLSLNMKLQILVGGSTRIPKIQELLSHKFGQAKLRCNANPEEAIAHGAAIIADALEV